MAEDIINPVSLSLTPSVAIAIADGITNPVSLSLSPMEEDITNPKQFNHTSCYRNQRSPCFLC
ncbi:hypothetical protein TSUD_99880 [Trifolium subterraneum]|uniref:Uncharacterized protein n=1 Tax=Trifolium subterraneum TaxID=3900 RepID=A0A2Z6NZB4_TRISU|nr:hypothetical protein TSUD_99880 [Trifolium subterraneum]